MFATLGRNGSPKGRAAQRRLRTTESNDNPAADLERIDPAEFAKLIAEASDEQIAEIVNGAARRQVLDEIFKRMADHVEPSQVAGLEAVVHFKILGRPEEQTGGYDHYEVVFADGACSATGEPGREPNVTLKLGPVDFLKLTANKASGPELFMAGKLQLEGDVALASRLTGFFRIPSAT